MQFLILHTFEGSTTQGNCPSGQEVLNNK